MSSGKKKDFEKFDLWFDSEMGKHYVVLEVSKPYITVALLLSGDFQFMVKYNQAVCGRDVFVRKLSSLEVELL